MGQPSTEIGVACQLLHYVVCSKVYYCRVVRVFSQYCSYENEECSHQLVVQLDFTVMCSYYTVIQQEVQVLSSTPITKSKHRPSNCIELQDQHFLHHDPVSSSSVTSPTLVYLYFVFVYSCLWRPIQIFSVNYTRCLLYKVICFFDARPSNQPAEVGKWKNEKPSRGNFWKLYYGTV